MQFQTQRPSPTLSTTLLRLVALVLGVALLTVPAGTAAANTQEQLHLFNPTYGGIEPLERGSGGTLFGTGFTAGATYSLLFDQGRFDPGAVDSGAHGVQQSYTVVADDDGTFSADFFLTTDVPADVSITTISAADDNGVLATQQIKVYPPHLSADVCPGQPVTATGTGFPNGTYVLSSSDVDFPDQPVQTSASGYLRVAGTAHASVPESFDVTATAQDATQHAWTWRWSRGRPQVKELDNGRTPWRVSIETSCFAPGETVAIIPSDTITSAPKSVQASAAGTVEVTLGIHPTPVPSETGGVELTGVTSGQEAFSSGGHVPGTQLRSGEVLTPQHMSIVSPSPAYEFTENYCHPLIFQYSPDGGGWSWWEAGPLDPEHWGTCRLVLSQRGNLALYSDSGSILWQTRSRGTRSNNVLKMHSNGNAAIYTATHARIWCSALDCSAVPSAARLAGGSSLRLGQSIKNGNTALTLLQNGNIVVRRAGVTVWSSRTGGRGGRTLLMRRDGLLALRNSQGRYLWSTHTSGASSAHLVVRDDGDVTVRNSSRQTMWHTGTGI